MIDSEITPKGVPPSTNGISRLRSVLVALALLLAVGHPTPASAALDILLINDDGIDAEGIQTLKDRLEAVGHDVMLVAPDGEASGSSAMVNLGEIFVLAPFDLGETVENEYAVSRVTEDLEEIDPEPATPIDCLVAAAALFDTPPDLVISGINSQHNTGPATQLSGTVGGAFGAASKLSPFGPLPAIAVNLEGIFFDDPDESSAEFEKAYGDAADFVVLLVEQLQDSAAVNDGTLLPAGVFLNVSYPARPLESIKGIKLSRQGDSYLGRVDDGDGQFVTYGVEGEALVLSEDTDTGEITLLSAPSLIEPDEGARDADSSALVEGYITIVPMMGDYTAEPEARFNADLRIRGLEDLVLRPSVP